MCTEGGGAEAPWSPQNDLRTSGFAELPPGPAKLVSQPQWRHQAYRHSVFSELIWIFCPSIFLHEYNKQSCPERMRLQRLMEFKSFLHFRFPDLFMTRVLGFLLYSRQEFQVSCSIQDKSFRFPALFRTRVSGRCFPMKLLVFNLKLFTFLWFGFDLGYSPELKTLEWCISGLMLDPLILIISRLTQSCKIIL